MKLKRGEKSARSIVEQYRVLKAKHPTQLLSREGLVCITSELSELGMYAQLLEIWDGDQVVATETVSILNSALRDLVLDRRMDIVQGLLDACDSMGRQRLKALLKLEMEQILGIVFEQARAREAKPQKQVNSEQNELQQLERMLEAITMPDDVKVVLSNIASKKAPLTIKESNTIFDKILEMEYYGYAVQLAKNEAVNIPESGNMTKVCNVLIERGMVGMAYNLVLSALLKPSADRFVSHQDLMQGIRASQSPTELVQLWNTLQLSIGIPISSIPVNILAKFLWQARKICLKPLQWDLSNESPLLRICIDIILQAPKRKKHEGLLKASAALLNRFIWQSMDTMSGASIDTTSFDTYNLPLFQQLVDELPAAYRDKVLFFMFVGWSKNNIERHRSMWPLEKLWPLASFISKTTLWTDESSHFMRALEATLVKRDLIIPYLKSRDEAFAIRFAVRNYLPSRSVGVKVGEGRKVPDLILGALQSHEKDTTKTGESAFVAAVLAVQKVTTPSSFVNSLARLLMQTGRGHEIVPFLESLDRYGIPLTRLWSDFVDLVRMIGAVDENGAGRVISLNEEYFGIKQWASLAASTAKDQPFLSRKICAMLRGRCPTGIVNDVAAGWSKSEKLSPRDAQEWIKWLVEIVKKPLGASPRAAVSLALEETMYRRREDDVVQREVERKILD